MKCAQIYREFPELADPDRWRYKASAVGYVIMVQRTWRGVRARRAFQRRRRELFGIMTATNKLALKQHGDGDGAGAGDGKDGADADGHAVIDLGTPKSSQGAASSSNGQQKEEELLSECSDEVDESKANELEHVPVRPTRVVSVPFFSAESPYD